MTAEEEDESVLSRMPEEPASTRARNTGSSSRNSLGISSSATSRRGWACSGVSPTHQVGPRSSKRKPSNNANLYYQGVESLDDVQRWLKILHAVQVQKGGEGVKEKQERGNENGRERERR